MPQDIKNFAEGVRKGLGIYIRCQCGKTVTFRAADFRAVLGPGEDIRDRVWRCSWCGQRAGYVRYTTIDRNDREGLAQWRPLPPTLR
ncbi:hypothetical protein ASG43_18215 [Aureimonas sp. Leaf454]|uniref:hypothetical protein n=1 Tax=Aureimonas sp. Leaf454 TaxID=1736381 RepID=UPI000701070A|nr:hypothetical protein [Aureimonas sp. Leaf454]KQT53761.1 hypothetical protein ASG43_18215 [Aureimonas sp. Leaf454]